MTRHFQLSKQVLCAAALLAALIAAPSAHAEMSAEDLAKIAQNPVGNLISVPFQKNACFNFGPLDGTQNVLNFQLATCEQPNRRLLQRGESGLCQQLADRRVSTIRVRPITADTALRLGLFFGMEPRFWLNLQSEYDMRMATRELKAKIAPRIRVFSPAAA
jgi:hypothetical protein